MDCQSKVKTSFLDQVNQRQNKVYGLPTNYKKDEVSMSDVLKIEISDLNDRKSYKNNNSFKKPVAQRYLDKIGRSSNLSETKDQFKSIDQFDGQILIDMEEGDVFGKLKKQSVTQKLPPQKPLNDYFISDKGLNSTTYRNDFCIGRISGKSMGETLKSDRQNKQLQTSKFYQEIIQSRFVDNY